MKGKFKFIPDRRPIAILGLAFEIITIVLALIWFDAKLAVIVYLIFWVRNLEISKRNRR